MHIQDIAVYLIVGAAAGFLVRNYWLSSQGKKGCGSCGTKGCSKPVAAKPGSQSNLIQITLQPSSDRPGGSGTPMRFRPVSPEPSRPEKTG